MRTYMYVFVSLHVTRLAPVALLICDYANLHYVGLYVNEMLRLCFLICV